MSENDTLNKQQKARLETLADDCSEVAGPLCVLTRWLAGLTRTPREDKIYRKLLEALEAVRNAREIADEGMETP